MISYFDYFPEKTKTELRSATILADDNFHSLPRGQYVFKEYFCTDLECDCQRVLIKVLHVESESAQPHDVATISYTWNEDEDEMWSFLNDEMPNPFLDPFHPQAGCASKVLQFWSEMLRFDASYAARIERHYHELRAAQPPPCGAPRPSTQAERANAGASIWTKGPVTKRERRRRKRKLEKAKRSRKSR